MKKQYHILNGDSLKEQFPKNITGNNIIVRECLVDGDVRENNLEKFFSSRAKFLSENYGGTQLEYNKKVVTEFQKIRNLDDDSELNLWFEDDLFCQVNFWFVVYLITNYTNIQTVFLVRPKYHNMYGFGGLNTSQLNSIYHNKISLTQLNLIGNLWLSYQKNDLKTLVDTAKKLNPNYPFILTAVKAHVEREPDNIMTGRPVKTLISIMNELGTKDFGSIFKEFNKREFIYGFGDMQVRRLVELIKNQNMII